MKEITLDTKISYLLDNYEGMKEILIKINPKFKKLNNPILRRTIAKVASVKQAAIVGGMEPLELVNKLRSAVGEQPLTLKSVETDKLNEYKDEVIVWIADEPKKVFDANELLEKDLNPLVEVHKFMKTIKDGDNILITSDFRPEPLIDEYIKKGHDVYCKEVSETEFLTYIRK